LEGFVFAGGEAGAEEEVFEGVAVEDAVDDDSQCVTLEVNAVVSEAESAEGFSRAFEGAEVLKVAFEDFLGQTAKFAKDVELEFAGHFGQFRSADGVEYDLKLEHGFDASSG
jgi:hypothetical protein